MSNPYDLIVFDWEGTIADTLGLVLHLAASEANLLGFKGFDLDQARKYIDLGLVEVLRKACPNLSASEQQQVLQAVQKVMHSRSFVVYLIPGARELIYQLHDAGVNLAVATNKGQESLWRALQATGLDKVFKVTRSAGRVPAKPCPQMLEEIMDEFGINAAKTLVIGDSVTDMHMARNIGVSAIGIDFYQQQAAELKAAGALKVFNDYSKVAGFLNLNPNKR